MQWIAIMAAFGWAALQVFLLFIWTQCIFGLIEFHSSITKHKWLNEVLYYLVLGCFYTLMVLPIISFVMFVYAVINISAWNELIPALWTFAIWVGTLFVFFILLILKGMLQDRYRDRNS